ncbi:class IIb bacteriocin, lactobin A/cerein 7B family [Flavobacteriaceae bacterium]|nr:class IIb bacteriocin, lactobin A/cerein 7B family [Flavobacteriaceae bacterium]
MKNLNLKIEELSGNDLKNINGGWVAWSLVGFACAALILAPVAAAAYMGYKSYEH